MARVLIVEDEAPIRANLMRFVRLEGHEAFEAADGREGLQVARDERPDLILCDVTMPHAGGLEVLAGLRNDAALALIPFVFLSASAEAERLEEALQLGANAYLTKPFNLAQLKAVLQTYLPANR
ncbi:MAG: response regulator [Polaromonas sp.]|nr:response regulator [Polaromonas sp.]